jgi:hypothetical protein
MVADATDDDPGRCVPLALAAAAGTVTGIDAVLLSAFENGMLGDDGAEIEDTDPVGQLLDLDDPASAVGHAVIIAADCDEAIVADASFELEHGVKAMLGQRLQFGLLVRESLGDDPLSGAVNADIGDSIKPVDELGVEVVEVAEVTAEKEVLADIAERPLDLPLGLGSVGSQARGWKR